MQAGKFREDLFYRLAVIRIEIPPLRERPEDIRWLTELILQQITAEQGTPIAMSEVFMRDVMARNWRGNVRELRAYLEHAVVLSDGGILDQPIVSHPGAREAGSMLTTPAGSLPQLHSVVDEAERVHIRKALAHCDGHLGKTAEALGISRKTLWDKMRRLDISA